MSSSHQGPDTDNRHHWQEEELEDQLEEHEIILDEMKAEIKRVREAAQHQLDNDIRVIENQERYRQAEIGRNRVAIALMEHRRRYGSRHRIVPENILDDASIASRESERAVAEAREREQRAPGGSARRDSLLTSPINASPQTPVRFATIGGARSPVGGDGAFRTPPRSDSNRSPNQEPNRNPNTSPINTPSPGLHRPLFNLSRNRMRSLLPPIVPPQSDELNGPLVNSPSDNDGRRPGNRQTRSAEGRQRRPARTEQFKPTLKF